MRLDTEIQKKIATTIPLALKKAVREYKNFLMKPLVAGKGKDDTEDKQIINRQAALKAMLAYIEMLIKLSDRLYENGSMNKKQKGEIDKYHLFKEAECDVEIFLENEKRNDDE
jgi:hypothetical protein